MRKILSLCFLLISAGVTADTTIVSSIASNNASFNPKYTVRWDTLPGTPQGANPASYFYKFGIAVMPCTFVCNGAKVYMGNYISPPPYTVLTWEQLMKLYTDTYGRGGNQTISTTLNSSGVGMISCFVGASSTDVATPLASTCSIITSVVNTCDWFTNDVGITHGNMDVNDVNGNVAELNASFQCLIPSTVKVRFMNSSVYLGNNVTSNLTVNGSSSSAVLPVNGSATVTLRSTLQTSGAQAGPLSGSAVAIIDVQ
ncbi:MrpH family fimbial adhesin [Aeromonas hydrophila]|uniref:MrpH family fimbial adhesin n=1 Tax=Aeromonas hydrophila TaxID=644 RepID=UPI0009541E52|nr:hypothetical protein [Aeromonas hydrophila]SIR20404.1 hypothetical protein SAMN05880569_10921 [Aeromonas hydrophila]SIR36980.1 hypothetical protein SAMN05878295_108110 [Aeromonas hydrophila]